MEKHRFIYYVPGLSSFKRDRFEEFGLAHLKGCSTPCRSGQGPDKGNGAFFVALPSGETLDGVTPGYWPDRQQWTCCEGGRYWVGWFKEQRPRPADLRKPVLRDVLVPIELGDENTWEFTPPKVLPLAFGATADGQLGVCPQPKFAQFYEAADWLWQFLQDGSDVQQMDLITKLSVLLGMNYWVGPWECIALRLFTQENFIEVSFAALDSIEYWRKKKAELIQGSASEKSDSSDGLEDTLPNTPLTGSTSSDTPR